MADRRFHEPTEEPALRFLMGVGRDSDGHARITRSDEFLLIGGSEATHGAMRATVEIFTETLRRMGTDLNHASQEEMQEAAEEAGGMLDG